MERIKDIPFLPSEETQEETKLLDKHRELVRLRYEPMKDKVGTYDSGVGNGQLKIV